MVTNNIKISQKMKKIEKMSIEKINYETWKRNCKIAQ